MDVGFCGIGFVCVKPGNFVSCRYGLVGLALPLKRHPQQSYVHSCRSTWHQASKRTFEFLSDWDSRAALIVFAIVDEVFRLLTLVHMHWARKQTYGKEAVSSLQKWANDRRSPVYMCLSYLSSLLAGSVKRLHLVIGFRGCFHIISFTICQCVLISYHVAAPPKQHISVLRFLGISM